MPCTPTTGLSHSYISQWANLTMLHQSPSLEVPSLDPIPSPARGRGRGRRTRKDENDDDECHTPRDRRSNCSPHPLQPVSSRGSLANLPVVSRPRATRRQPMPNPTLNFRRLAHTKADAKPLALGAAPLHRTPSDVTNTQQHTETTPSPDMIFNMSPVLGIEGPSSSRPYRVPSRLSAEPGIVLNESPIRIDCPERSASRDPSFLYSYTWEPPATDPLPPCSPSIETRTVSIATSRDRTTTSGLLADNDNTASELLADESSSQLEESELAVDSSCLVEPAIQAIPRLGRMHAKSDPLPARLSSLSPSNFEPGCALKSQPIPIPKPAPRVPSDFGGVSSISVSLAPSAPLAQQGGIQIPVARWARVPVNRRPKREPENENLPVQEEVEPATDVTGEWCGTADAVPARAARRTARKKRFFIGESYDGDMDSEFSSLHPR